jgi:hypothetical protein
MPLTRPDQLSRGFAVRPVLELLDPESFEPLLLDVLVLLGLGDAVLDSPLL